MGDRPLSYAFDFRVLSCLWFNFISFLIIVLMFTYCSLRPDLSEPVLCDI